MKARWVLVAALLSSGCGSDDEASPSVGAGGESSGGGGEGVTEPDDCRDGCEQTLAADCDNGPTSRAECESDCRMLAAGACGGEYQSLQECARGEAVECSAEGLPIVPECSDLQAAFVACLSAD